MRDHLLVAVRRHDRVHVRRAHRVAAHGAQQLAYRAIVGHAVELRLVGLERIAALGVGEHATAQLELGFRILDVVDAVGARLPDIQRRAGNRLAVDRQHAAGDPGGLALDGGALGEVGAVFEIRRAVHEERPEHRRFGRPGRRLVVERDHHHRQAEDVGEQDELLALVVALLADGGEELDAFEPFFFRELHLACECVQVLHRAGDDLPEAFVFRAAAQPLDDRGGERVFVELPHGLLLRMQERKCIIKRRPCDSSPSP